MMVGVDGDLLGQLPWSSLFISIQSVVAGVFRPPLMPEFSPLMPVLMSTMIWAPGLSGLWLVSTVILLDSCRGLPFYFNSIGVLTIALYNSLLQLRARRFARSLTRRARRQDDSFHDQCVGWPVLPELYGPRRRCGDVMCLRTFLLGLDVLFDDRTDDTATPAQFYVMCLLGRQRQWVVREFFS